MKENVMKVLKIKPHENSEVIYWKPCRKRLLDELK